MLREDRMPCSFTGYRHLPGVLMKLKWQEKACGLKQRFYWHKQLLLEQKGKLHMLFKNKIGIKQAQNMSNKEESALRRLKIHMNQTVVLNDTD